MSTLVRRCIYWLLLISAGSIVSLCSDRSLYFRFSQKVDNCTSPLEEDLLDSVLGSLISKDETIMGRLFLEANVHDQSCQTLLSKWDHLKPSTQKVLSLVSRAKKFEKEKECIILNLAKAEQEVIINDNKTLLF